ncbi:Ig-like domain repeat protein [Granulicella sp. WH15]|uniref:Ig-like domain repeat protein n=1 Tax=Granulicella sp. WH15 TaxID=2602070 RepID=UPI0013A5AF99|nr:Ig-like domain repeat protein [Granulicella sp. WH15]
MPSRLFAFVVALAVLCSFAPAQSPSFDTQASRVTILSHSAKFLASAVDAGPLPSSQPLQLTLTLTPTPDRAAALDQFLTDLADPTSPSYHQWMTPQAFASTYGVTADQLAAITTWAQSQGFTIGALSAGGTRLALTGTAAQVQSAFAIGLHAYQISGKAHFATPDQPLLPLAIAPAVTAIAGLDDLPSAFTAVSIQSSGTAVPSTEDAFTQATTAIDSNTAPILAITSTVCASTYTPSQTDQYRILFRQAAAQGISVLATSGCGVSGSFPASLPEVTAITLTGTADDTDPTTLRPSWQSAPGLPANSLRVEPDLTTPSLDAFTQTIATILQSPTSSTATLREGNLNATLYKLAPLPGLYTQPDAPATPGTTSGNWEPPTGLGTVNLKQLIKAFPRGTSASFVSLAVSNYAPTHGQNTTLTATITSGSGGGIPTGTVAFVTSTGTTLGTVPLNAAGAASLTTNALPGGSVSVTAQYSGDATYAAANSTASTLSVLPEPAQLTATVTTGNIVGGTFTITVTETVTLGQPTGVITVSLLGRSYTGTLAPVTPTSSAVAITIPASPDTVGSSTLSSNCITNANYTCYTALTTTVTVGKATPVLNYTFSPNPVISGSSVAFTASLAAIGTAPAPTGNVRFLDNATLLNAGTLTNGATTAHGTVTTAATHVITAAYDGDANYFAVTSSTPGTTIGTAATATTLTSSATTVIADQPITLTAKVTPATASTTTPTGSVTFFDGATALGSISLSSGTAVLPISTLSASAAHSITATYSGDVTYAASTSAPVALTPSLAAPAISLTSNVTSTLVGNSIVLTARVTSPTTGTGAPTGLVTFFDTFNGTATQLAAVSLTPSGAGAATASYATLTLATGTHNLYAVYAGDSTFATAQSAPPLTVTISDYTAAFAPPTMTLTQGGSGQATFSLSPVSGFTGTVIFTCTAPANSGITCSFSPATLTGSGTTTLNIATTPAQTSSLRTLAGGTAALATLLSLLFPSRRRRRLLPTLLLLLLALGITSNLGCGSDSTSSNGLSTGGTPFGTSVLNITATGTVGTATIRHTYTYQVTVQ